MYRSGVDYTCRVCNLSAVINDGVVYKNNDRNGIKYIAAIGGINTKPRAAQYSFADKYFAIITQDYTVDKHLIYYISTGGIDKSLALICDEYYPTFEGANKSVLVNIRSSGSDKDIGNYAHRNKYIASRVYIIYDIQIGI